MTYIFASIMRSIINYSDEDMESIIADRAVLVAQIGRNTRTPEGKIYKQQRDCAKKVVSNFNDEKQLVCQLVIGNTQTGKTGCMAAIIGYTVKYTNIYSSNIFIITGLSSTDWVTDTRSRMPDDLKGNIFHLGQLDKFSNNIKGKKNCLILIDEIQIASKDRNILSKIFIDIGLYNIEYLYANDIKIVQFTATPDGHLYDIKEWGNMSSILFMTPGEGYISAYNLLQQGKIRQYKSLLIRNNVQDVYDLIKEKYDEPLYHTIRIPSSKNNGDNCVIELFKSIFGQDYIYITKFLNIKKVNINDLLVKKPEKHSIIFIKDIMRCAKTKYKKYLGIEYERYTNNPYDTTIIQGSVGRITGYDYNGISICFTNIESIERYAKLWKSQFTDLSVAWFSSTTTINGSRNNTKTLNSATNYAGMKIVKNIKWGYAEIVFKSYDDFKKDNTNNTLGGFTEWVKKSLNYKNIGNKFDIDINVEAPTKLYKTSTTSNLKYVTQKNLEKELMSWGFKSGFDYKLFKNDIKTKWVKDEILAARSYVCYNDFNDITNPIICIRLLKGSMDSHEFNKYNYAVDEEILKELVDCEDDLTYDVDTKLLSYNNIITTVWDCEHPTLMGEEKFKWGICFKEQTDEYKEWLCNNGN